MIQRIFPRQGERGGLFHLARAPWLDDQGGKITLQGQEPRATGDLHDGRRCCTSC